MDVLRDRVRERLWLQALIVTTIAFVIYVVFRAAHNPYNQYVLLADAFLHKRLYLIDPPAFLEIAKFGTKSFVIDPPAPTIFLLPVVAIFGKGADHVLVSCGVGAGAIGFFYVAARRLWSDVRFAIAMTVLVAFGTDFFWLASDGGFWSFAHVSAVFFLAAGLAEATGRKRPWLVALCVGLAGLSRLPTFLVAPIYIYLVLDGDLRVKRENVSKVIEAGLVLAACALFYVTYNYARYGTIQDLGYYHPQYLNEPWFQKGRFDITYIPRHIRAIFYEFPSFKNTFPYVFPHYVGTALILTTPAFLYSLRARLTKQNIVAIATLGLVSIPLITHGAVGFSQFGYRFAMDAIPCLLLLTASGMREELSKVKIGVIAFCVLVNLWGVLAFSHFHWVVN